MFSCPDHPDIVHAMRTGEPPRYNTYETDYEKEDWDYETRRDMEDDA